MQCSQCGRLNSSFTGSSVVSHLRIHLFDSPCCSSLGLTVALSMEAGAQRYAPQTARLARQALTVEVKRVVKKTEVDAGP